MCFWCCKVFGFKGFGGKEAAVQVFLAGKWFLSNQHLCTVIYALRLRHVVVHPAGFSRKPQINISPERHKCKSLTWGNLLWLNWLECLYDHFGKACLQCLEMTSIVYRYCINKLNWTVSTVFFFSLFFQRGFCLKILITHVDSPLRSTSMLSLFRH